MKESCEKLLGRSLASLQEKCLSCKKLARKCKSCRILQNLARRMHSRCRLGRVSCFIYRPRPATLGHVVYDKFAIHRWRYSTTVNQQILQGTLHKAFSRITTASYDGLTPFEATRFCVEWIVSWLLNPNKLCQMFNQKLPRKRKKNLNQKKWEKSSF